MVVSTYTDCIRVFYPSQDIRKASDLKFFGERQINDRAGVKLRIQLDGFLGIAMCRFVRIVVLFN